MVDWDLLGVSTIPRTQLKLFLMLGIGSIGSRRPLKGKFQSLNIFDNASSYPRRGTYSVGSLRNISFNALIVIVPFTIPLI